MLNSEPELDDEGYPKCSDPPNHKEKFINPKIKIVSSSSECEDSDDSNDADVLAAVLGLPAYLRRGRPGSDSSRSPSPKRPKIKFNEFGCYDKSDDEEDSRYITEIPSQEMTLKVDCYWTIENFSYCELNTESYINSKIFSAGLHNEILWYFRVERLRQKDEVFYGFYVQVLTPSSEEITIDFTTYLIDSKVRKHGLSRSSKFPCKEGLHFLGFFRKSYIRDDNTNYLYMIPEDEMTLTFRINIQYRKIKDQLHGDMKSLLDKKINSDFNLIVKGNKFPCHKAILAARSPVFADLFNKKKAPIEHKIENVQPEMMNDLLRYLYTGRIKRLVKYLNDFSTVADKYKLTELKSICDKVKISFSQA